MADVSEVVVTANTYTGYGPSIDFGGGYHGYGTAIGGSNPPVGAGDHLLLFEPTNNSAPTQAQVLADGKIVAQTIAQLNALIANIPDSAQVTLPGGQTFNGSHYETGAQLKATWALTDFIVSDNTDYANGGIGQAVYGNGGRNTVTLSTAAVEQYGKFVSGDAFLLLHELAHVTPAGDDFFHFSYKEYGIEWQHGNHAPWQQSDEWVNNEKYANDVAHAIDGLTGINDTDIYTAFGGEGLTHAQNPVTVYNIWYLDNHG